MSYKAFIEATGANITNNDGTIRRVEFDSPQPKLIASGSEVFCQDALARYMAKHPDSGNGGVIEVTERGDPWHAQWAKVHASTSTAL